MIRDIHREYLEAGADLVETNTFSAQRISQADYGMEDLAYEMNSESARLAREACDAVPERTPDRPRWVIGALGPTNTHRVDLARRQRPRQAQHHLRPAGRGLPRAGQRPGRRRRRPAAGRDDLRHPQREGRDLRARDALRGARPALAGDHLRHHHRRLGPHAVRPGHRGVLELGAARPAARGRPQLRARRRRDAALRRRAVPRRRHASSPATPTPACPTRSASTTRRPTRRPRCSSEFAGSGLVNLLGGCCGTTPEHIAAIAQAAKGKSRRASRPRSRRRCGCPASSRVTITDESLFVNVGERTNITGSARFRRLIKEGDYDTALTVARQQVETGAQVIDINMDEGMIDGVEAMDRFLKLIASEPDISPGAGDGRLLEVRGDRGRPQVRAGQADRQLDLDEGGRGAVPRARPALPQVRRRRRRDGVRRGRPGRQPRAPQGRSAERAYDILVDEVGFPAEDIIFDPNIFAVATGIEEHANYGVDFIEATRWIKENLPGALVSGGVSNVSFSFRGNNPVREAIHAVFLYHAIEAGHGHGHRQRRRRSSSTTRSTPELRERIEDVVLNRRDDADRAAAGDRPDVHASDGATEEAEPPRSGARCRSASGSRTRW